MAYSDECIEYKDQKSSADLEITQSGENAVLSRMHGSISEPSESSTSSVEEDTETVGRSNTGSDDNKANIKKKLSSKREELKLDTLRYLVLLILIIAAVSISVIVYILTSTAETDEFELQYEAIAPKVLARLTAVKEFISVVNTIGSAMTSQGMYQEKHKLQSWPFVTLPDFHWRGQVVRSISHALYVSVFPIVVDGNRDAWEEYVVGIDGDWIETGLEYQKELGLTDFEHEPPTLDYVLMRNMTRKPIFYLDRNGTTIEDSDPGPYIPKWQTSPVLMNDDVNGNLYKVEGHHEMVHHSSTHGSLELSYFVSAPAGDNTNNSNSVTRLLATLHSFAEKERMAYNGGPIMYSYLPIFDTFDQLTKKPVGIVQSIFMWEQYFRNILPTNQRGIVLVLENTCNGFFTYELDGPEVNLLGHEDLHDTKFNKYEFVDLLGTYDINITDGSKEGLQIDSDSCIYKLHVYPSQVYVDAFKTNTPVVMTSAVALVFMLAIVLFLFFNIIVERRQRIILQKAVQSTAIVSSLFPKQVRDRLLEQDDEQDPNNRGRSSTIAGSNHVWSSFVGAKETGTRQIADLFPNCTVLFADVVGFTAWSSTRGPEHVFVLLQTLYNGFDQIARRRNVFKVETIGDCYLAVTGLPEPQPTHAVIMARFAYDCLLKMRELMSELDVTLGPDCSDLKMRFGMNSGPVTAGVLRGERARFQLFGDTVNTAARMESTGVPGRIQISETTADLLHFHGKGHWMKPREDQVVAKGKGVVSTFWLNPSRPKNASTSVSSGQESSERVCDQLEQLSSNGNDMGQLPLRIGKDTVKERRMVDWMVELLIMHIRKMVAKRKQFEKISARLNVMDITPNIEKNYLEEVVEVIPMSKFELGSTQSIESSDFAINEELVASLREYVTIIANMYNNNPFHNFEHACHVTMSVSKLLTRIVSPVLRADDTEQESDIHLYERTYGISSDPLAQFAIVFSALIHDVDHRGCSNEQLIKEDLCMAKLYRGKSVAEQNSLDLAWGLLMSSQFDRLRSEIFSGHADLRRFRQIIVNSVMATDIFDKELNSLRKVRWERAFATNAASEVDHMDRKATIVIEHIIQASDVSHTMQHWHIYRKWNKQLFKEMYAAYLEGRMVVDPSTFWYKGELSFFDNYVIPLAKKLEECNVFGVSSDECLNYAVGNRKEWEQKGESIVAENLSEIIGSGNAESERNRELYT